MSGLFSDADASGLAARNFAAAFWPLCLAAVLLDAVAARVLAFDAGALPLPLAALVASLIVARRQARAGRPAPGANAAAQFAARTLPAATVIVVAALYVGGFVAAGLDGTATGSAVDVLDGGFWFALVLVLMPLHLFAVALGAVLGFRLTPPRPGGPDPRKEPRP